MIVTVSEARELCKQRECDEACPLSDLCRLTAYIGPTLDMWYENMQYPPDKTIREVINEHIAEHEEFLMGLKALRY